VKYLHKYHFFLFILMGIVVVCGWSFVKPKMLEVTRLQLTKEELIKNINTGNRLVEEEDKIQAQVLDIKNKMASYIRFNDRAAVKAELLTTILQTGEQYGFVIKVIDSVSWHERSETELLNIHVIANGTFSQFYAFIDKLFQYSLPCMISNFSISVLPNGLLEIDMHLGAFFIKTADAQWVSLPQWKSRSNRKELGEVLDPFYKAKHEVELKNFSSSEFVSRLNAISYDQIKFVGYMVDDDRRWALAKLPDGEAVEIFQNVVFGVEKVRVESISEEGVVIEINGEKKLMHYVINHL